ncbi:MAG: hypothetical protein KDA85_03080, partial [Planctomycetaceae bacterium]|nr:hypothetical protein [Planctomycetaceae bacterium]
MSSRLAEAVARTAFRKSREMFRGAAGIPSGQPADQPLGEALVEAGLLRREDLEGSLSRQVTSRRRLGELLIEMGLIEEDRLLPFLGQRLGVPGVRLREGLVDPGVVRLIPRA